MDCIFCKLQKGEIPSEIVFENDKVVVFKDINPLAKVHLLVIPREHILNVNEIEPKNAEIMGEMFLAAKKAAEISGIAQSGYRTIINSGADAGQEVGHIHLHIMGGEKLGFLN